MRLLNISSIEEGNNYLPEFITKGNDRFAVKAQDPQDAHPPLQHNIDSLYRILSKQSIRCTDKNLEFSYGRGTVYKIQRSEGGYR